MKDIKTTLKATVKRKNETKTPCMAIFRKVAKDYVLLALFVAATVYLFLHIYCANIIPALELTTGSFFSRLQLEAKDYGFISLFAVSSLIMLYASLRAHRCMHRTIGIYKKRMLGGRRRTILLVECTAILIVSFCVAALPPFVLSFSAAASAETSIGGDAQAIPTWAVIGFLLTTFAAAMFAEVAVTFVRLCFRDLDPAENAFPEVGKTPNE